MKVSIINRPNDKISDNTQYLIINCQYHYDIPDTVIHLEMNHTVYSRLPQSIVYLTIGHRVSDSYNIPKSVKYLFIDNNLIHYIPNSVISLRFSSRFTHPLDNILPINLKRLSIGKNYPHDLLKLPKTLEELFVHNIDKIKINSPSNLKLVQFLKKKINLENIINLPHNCEILDYFRNPI